MLDASGLITPINPRSSKPKKYEQYIVLIWSCHITNWYYCHKSNVTHISPRRSSNPKKYKQYVVLIWSRQPEPTQAYLLVLLKRKRQAAS